MTALVIAVRLFCLLPFATGLADLLLGARVFEPAGLSFPVATTNNPVLNSQIGFWGAIWFGMALLLWKCTIDLVRHKDWFCLLCGILFLSGVGRAIAAVRFGLPPAPLFGAMILELVGVPVAVLWHHLVLKRLSKVDGPDHAK